MRRQQGKQKRSVGIDLGTTYSCVAVLQHGNVEIIADRQDNRTTPSYVAFESLDETGILVGHLAKKRIKWNPDTTVFDAKRMIGRKFNDPEIKSKLENWTFKVVNDHGKPKFCVNVKGVDKKFFPEEISSFVLKDLKSYAETYLDAIVKDAVITVPAYFQDAQRKATIEAAESAGLNVLSIINEPTAAALAYGMEKKDKREHNVLIYDLGGGTFDVSIVTIKDKAYEVKSTAGDAQLGGRDFDNLMVDHFLREFKQKHKREPVDIKWAVNCLLTECENAKCKLSSVTQAQFTIYNLSDDIDFTTSISRAKFEDLCADLFQGTLKEVQKALDGANMHKSSIDDIVLVGGSTHIPKVQKLIQDFFGGKHLNKSINPDEAVAYGAAIQAAMLSGDISVQNLKLVDIVSHSLGISIIDDGTPDVMSIVIEKNSTIPAKQTKSYYTSQDNQTSVSIRIFEGEDKAIKNNNLLGKFNLEPVPPAPAGNQGIDVTFDIDSNGILDVSAVVRSTGKKMNIVLKI